MDHVKQIIMGTSLLNGIDLNYICVIYIRVLGQDTIQGVFRMIYQVVLKVWSFILTSLPVDYDAHLSLGTTNVLKFRKKKKLELLFKYIFNLRRKNVKLY